MRKTSPRRSNAPGGCQGRRVDCRVSSTAQLERCIMDSTQVTPKSQRPLVLAILCPHCGQPYTRPLPAPFDQSLSSLLDWLIALEHAAKQARAAVDEVAL